jgi:hypothetical protein
MFKCAHCLFEEFYIVEFYMVHELITIMCQTSPHITNKMPVDHYEFQVQVLHFQSLETLQILTDN